MLGGGIFTTQNKVLPGSYINVVGKKYNKSPIGERGVVAIALPLKTKGDIITIGKENFPRDCQTLFGVPYTDPTMMPIREILKNAEKVYVYDLGKGEEQPKTPVTDIIKTFDSYEFNILVAYTDVAEDITAYITGVKDYRDNGKKCQLVVYNATTPNHEGVINVKTEAKGEGIPAYGVLPWVGGALAGCPVNKSCTNKLYNGELTLDLVKSQSDLETNIKNGEFVFHRVYDEPRVLMDINSLTAIDENKNESFKDNQTIRVLDQTVNDIARIFNTQFLGVVSNDMSGRASLWGRIVAHHREMEKIGAIEAFDSKLLTVEKGETKLAVVVNDAITPINAMAKIYMTIVVD